MQLLKNLKSKLFSSRSMKPNRKLNQPKGHLRKRRERIRRMRDLRLGKRLRRQESKLRMKQMKLQHRLKSR